MNFTFSTKNGTRSRVGIRAAYFVKSRAASTYRRNQIQNFLNRILYLWKFLESTHGFLWLIT